MLAGVAARFNTPLNVVVGNHSEQAHGELVTGTYFETLGIGTALLLRLGGGDQQHQNGGRTNDFQHDDTRLRNSPAAAAATMRLI